MRQLRLLLVSLVIIAATACYHATIETGATPSSTVIRKGFASGWIFGLVPPSAVETASRCPNGVARIETQLSFVNQLVAFLTLYIYTPMQIVVTCATSGSASAQPADGSRVIEIDPDSPSGVEDALAAAVRKSLQERRPIYVRFN